MFKGWPTSWKRLLDVKAFKWCVRLQTRRIPCVAGLTRSEVTTRRGVAQLTNLHTPSVKRMWCTTFRWHAAEVTSDKNGRYINDRTSEHAASVKTQSAGGHLPTHCRACQCSARFYDVNIVARSKTKLGRENLEALAMEEKGNDCISAPSPVLHEKVKIFLGGVNILWWIRKQKRGKNNCSLKRGS